MLEQKWPDDRLIFFNINEHVSITENVCKNFMNFDISRFNRWFAVVGIETTKVKLYYRKIVSVRFIASDKESYDFKEFFFSVLLNERIGRKKKGRKRKRKRNNFHEKNDLIGR